MLRGLHRCVVALLAIHAMGCSGGAGEDARPLPPPPLPKVSSEPVQAQPQAPPPTPPPARDKRPKPGKSLASTPAPKHDEVKVPRTAHVWAEFPSGLQADLDADPRMQEWLDAAIATIDKCHASSRGSRGVVEGLLTMHVNDRPDLTLTSMPAAVSLVIACATGPLTKDRPPLFTGKEGRQYVVRLHFE